MEKEVTYVQSCFSIWHALKSLVLLLHRSKFSLRAKKKHNKIDVFLRVQAVFGMISGNLHV